MKINNNIVKIVTVKFPQTSFDGYAFAKLSTNARKVFQALENLANIEAKKKWDINIVDTAMMLGMPSEAFIEALNEIEYQNYFMYYRANTDDYLFGNTKMVF